MSEAHVRSCCCICDYRNPSGTNNVDLVYHLLGDHVNPAKNQHNGGTATPIDEAILLHFVCANVSASTSAKLYAYSQDGWLDERLRFYQHYAELSGCTPLPYPFPHKCPLIAELLKSRIVGWSSLNRRLLDCVTSATFNTLTPPSSVDISSASKTHPHGYPPAPRRRRTYEDSFPNNEVTEYEPTYSRSLTSSRTQRRSSAYWDLDNQLEDSD